MTTRLDRATSIIPLVSVTLSLALAACASDPTAPPGAPTLARAAAGAYILTDLGRPGLASTGWAIGPGGRIVGNSQFPGTSVHATLWERGATLDLGTLGGRQSEATGRSGRAHV